MLRYIVIKCTTMVCMTCSALGQYVASGWIPLSEISDRHDYVMRFAMTSDGAMYMTLRMARNATGDTFSVYSITAQGQRANLILDVAEPRLYWTGEQHFQVHGTTAFLSASNGLNVFRDGNVIHQSTGCVPYRGFVSITATDDNELLVSSYRDTIIDGQQTVTEIVVRHSLDGCEELSSRPFTFWRGSEVGIGRNATGETLLHYTAGRTENDTVFYRLDGTGVPSELRALDRGFKSYYFTGYEDGWIVVGDWSRLLITGAMKLDANMRVVDTVMFEEWVSPYPSSYRRVINSDDKLLFLCSRVIYITDKATLETTRFVFEDWDRGEGAEYGTEMVDAAMYQGKLYVATDKGIRVFTKDPVSVQQEDPARAPTSTVLLSADAPSFNIRGCFERELSVYDLLGRHYRVVTTPSSDGVHIYAHSISPGLNVIVLPNGLTYAVLREL